MINLNNIKLLLVFTIAIMAANVYLLSINMVSNIAQRPLLSIAMRIAILVMLTILLILKKKVNFVYLSLISIVLFRLSLNGISIITIISFTLLVLYYGEILVYIKREKDIFRFPFYILAVSIAYTTYISSNKYEAIDKALIFADLYILYVVYSIYFISKISNKIRFICMLIGILLLGIFTSYWQLLFGVNSIKYFYGSYGINVTSDPYFKRIPGFFTEAQGAGVYYAVMIIVLIGLKNTILKRSKALLRILIVLSISGLLLTGTRIAIIALTCGYVYLQLQTAKFKKLVAICFIFLMLLMFGGIVYNYIIPNHIKTRLSGHYLVESADLRANIWKNSWPIIIHNPLGVGLGGNNLYSAGIKQNVMFLSYLKDFPGMRVNTHFESSYLTLLYSLGIFGFSGFVVLMVIYFKSAHATYKTDGKTVEAEFCIYLSSAMMVFLIGISVSPQLYNVPLGILFVIFLSYINALSKNRAIDYTIAR